MGDSTMADVPDASTIVTSLAMGFQSREDGLRRADAASRQPAERSLDAMDEAALVALTARVLSEQFEVVVRPPRPSSHRSRFAGRDRPADLVLTPPGRPVWPPGGPDLFTPSGAVPPEKALWVMVRVVWRWTPPGVVQMPGAADLKRFQRLASDPLVHHAAMLVLAFLTDPDELAHVLVATDGLLRQDPGLWQYDSELRHVRTLSLTDRRGHRAMVVGLWPVRLWRSLLSPMAR